MSDELTPDQVVANEMSRHSLVIGRFYRFEPPVTAAAFPIADLGICKVVECEFDRGKYLGFTDGKHVFEGRPINDTRVMSNCFRLSFFRVLFVGGSKVIPDGQENNIVVGQVYTLARRDIGGLLYARMYDEGRFINVRVLSRTNEGCYICTTRDEVGQYLGPGGGWPERLEREMVFYARDLEALKTQ